MLSGKIQKIKKDHQSWLSLIDEFNQKIAQFQSKLESGISKGNSKILNELLHHKRILNKLQTAINSHRLFIDEIAGETGITMEFLDLEGHERNHQHLLNFEDSFAKLIHEMENSPNRERAYS